MVWCGVVCCGVVWRKLGVVQAWCGIVVSITVAKAATLEETVLNPHQGTYSKCNSLWAPPGGCFHSIIRISQFSVPAGADLSSLYLKNTYNTL